MPDYFALLDVPRSPWLDAELLKEQCQTLIAAAHPDRFPNATDSEKSAIHQRFTELNAAAVCLREVRARLKHLLELETGRAPDDLREAPTALTDLFFEVANACREVDKFLAEKDRVSSPLLKVQMMERALEWNERLAAIQVRLRPLTEGMERELQQLSAAWTAAPPMGSADRRASLPLEKLEEVYRLWGFVSRWNARLKERILRLTF